MQAFVPKNRRPRFELVLRVLDLNNVPLSSGTAFVKWSLPPSATAEHRGTTDKAIVIDHRAYWSYERAILIRLTIDRNQTLQERDILFEVVQEFESGSRDDKTLLGRVKLNLAEYADRGEDDEVITRRYLMQDSKVNSTLKVAIIMRHVEGDRNYSTPPLKSPLVFGGITGVVSSEQGDTTGDDPNQNNSRNTKSRETADLQDMYRRSLVASFNAPSSDLPADKLIEDLFSGGTGWNKGDRRSRTGSRRYDDGDRDLPPGSDLESRQAAATILENGRLSSSGFGKRPRSLSSNQSRFLSKAADLARSTSRSTKTRSIEQQFIEDVRGDSDKKSVGRPEVSEFDVREDLRSWEVSNPKK